jgi:hypothetical protein
MTHLGLPPRIAEITDDGATWQRLEGIDYEALGYFLSCHLIIEHYLDELLKICHPSLDWDAARLTFGKKAALLSNLKTCDQYDCIPAIKHMNSLRNKLSHDIEFKIKPEDLFPLNQYLAKVYSKVSDDESELPAEPKDVLGWFTMITCVHFAGYISGRVHVRSSLAKGVITPPSRGDQG